MRVNIHVETRIGQAGLTCAFKRLLQIIS